MSVFCTVFAVVILNAAPWSIYSAFSERRYPYTSAINDYLNFKHPKYNSSAEDDSTTYKQKNYTLVKVPQLLGDDGPVYDSPTEKQTGAILKILWYNRPSWFGEEEEVREKSINRCLHGNCVITYNRSLLEEVDALVFDATASNFPQNPPLTPPERDPNQVWIFYGLESPFYYQNNHFKSIQWRSVFNWTMTYRLDSDIPHPYGILLTNHYPPDRNYRAIFRSKTKFAAWIVSNCNAVSGRDDFVRRLQTYVPVDIFGHCGTKNCSKKNTDCRDNIGKNYKFYLSFENSLCRDYITEKLFQYFPLDLITVQRGYSNYDSLLPNGTYINSADFSIIKELANFMTRLAGDEDRFIRYLKFKDKYIPKGYIWTYSNALCNICNKLNNLEKYKRSYNDIVSWLEKNTCSSASDIR